MEKQVDVFDIEKQRHVGKYNVSELDKYYDFWRSKGYGVLIDREGGVCLDNEDSEDDGKYYTEQLKDCSQY